jgi:hypothetical protein
MIPAFDFLKSHSQWTSDLRAGRGMLSLVAGLREFFRDPVTPEKAGEEIRRAVETRGQRFLDLVRTQVYDREGSPYLKLFRMAGCDFADLQAQMRRHGLEKTLEKLTEEGVYLTQDEFKGKKEIVRGARFAVAGCRSGTHPHPKQRDKGPAAASCLVSRTFGDVVESFNSYLFFRP